MTVVCHDDEGLVFNKAVNGGKVTCDYAAVKRHQIVVF